jgi:hypothetical protein
MRRRSAKMPHSGTGKEIIRKMPPLQWLFAKNSFSGLKLPLILRLNAPDETLQQCLKDRVEDIQGGSQQHQPPFESAQIYGMRRYP